MAFGAVKAAYIQHGDDRPSFDNLQEYIEALQAPNRVPTSARVNYPKQLVLADIYLDASRASDTTLAYIDKAEQALQMVVDSKGNRWPHRKIQAAFKLADLPRWRATEAPLSQADDYDHRLDALEGLFSRYSNERLAQKDLTYIFTEVVPIMLGVRNGHGTLGRLALLREEAREATEGALGENWDTALSYDTPTLLDNPLLQVQIKTTEFKQRPRIRAGGVATLIAAQCGFKDPLSVLRECVEEAYGPDSARLDEITGRVDENLAQELQLIHELNQAKAVE